MQKIRVENAAGRFDEGAADTVILLALMLARAKDGPEAALSGRTLGLVGFDQTARAAARRAGQGFGMKVLVHDASGIDPAIADRLGVEISPSLDHLLCEADFVSLHARPGRVRIDAHRLNQMKPDACLINTSHGALIDEMALLHALWFETIGGAGMAVPAGTLDRLADFAVCDNAILLQGPSEARPIPTPVPASVMGDNVVNLFEGREQRA